MPPSTPWHAAPPILVDVRLRRTGRYERRGAPNRIRDRAAERRLLAEPAVVELGIPKVQAYRMAVACECDQRRIARALSML